MDFNTYDATTRSPVWLAWTAASFLLASAVLLLFLGQKTNLDGSASANLFGWISGAVVIPLGAVLFRHIEASRKEASTYHLSNRGAQEAFKWILVMGILLATLHGAAFAMEMK